MQTTISQREMTEIAIESGNPGYVSSVRVGTITMSLAYSDTVQCGTLFDTRCTMVAIRTECMAQGIQCSEPQALAAAYSVPNGASILMAVVNVGPMPTAEIAEIFGKMRANVNGAVNRMTR